MTAKTFFQKVSDIQSALKAPKSQYNAFGKYHYRKLEDIYEAVKPLLNGLVLTVSDDIVAVGDRIYVKATATITDGESSISTTAFAREPIAKKGMDDAQLTGSCHSYAAKYALSALLLCDDTNDADSEAPASLDDQIAACDSIEALVSLHKSMSDKDRATYKDKFTARREEITNG